MSEVQRSGIEPSDLEPGVGHFEPRVIAFLCNWCSYSGADSAGKAQKSIPANIHVIRVMCSGRVDPQFVVQAFRSGADGVLVLGCHPGDCHYRDGNRKAMVRAKLLGKVLKEFGIEEERFRLDWVSASEGERFAELTNRMVDDLRKVGPLVLLV